MNSRLLLGLSGTAVLIAAVSQGCSSDETVGTAGPGTTGAGGSGGDQIVGVGGSTGDCIPACEQGAICSHGACVPPQTCATDDDCSNDTYCDPATGCMPWEGQDPEHDPECVYVTAAGTLQPAVRCEFSTPPAGDPFPDHVDVQATPIVINFNGFEPLLDGDKAPIGTPSIVASFTAPAPPSYTENLGVIRVLSGKDCSLEANLGGTDLDGDGVIDWTYSSAALAAADLDGDEKPEIVAYGGDGSTLAFKRTMGVWGLLWKATTSAGGPVYIAPINGGWAGPSIHDLDDDGVPEILREGAVIGADGVLRSPSPPVYASYSQGLFSVTADLDGDPAIETTNGQFIWEWQNGWVQEPYFPGATASAPGHVAIADFGAFGQGPATQPELAVVRDGFAMVYALTGELAQPPIAVPGGGGGPPTVADFDGDGLPELAVAGQAYYTIYDIDCGPTPRANGTCPGSTCDFGPCPEGIAWSRTTQDVSSNITGSSVFDFEADGTDEVVYADECFVRVYNGVSGEVIFSQYRSSCTWYENPIIADVDGNYRADLVTPSNRACSPNGEGIACNNLTADGVDSQFAGLHCQTGDDCVSGTCDSGLCRCATSAECCSAGADDACIEEGFKCSPPPLNTPGAGNTCRASHPHGISGIRVYSDANDKWVRSRMIWNQHAYAVTHVEEDGTVPASSAWTKNWTDPTLNNFRTNVPGGKGGQSTPDFTTGAADEYACIAGGVNLSAPVCNRGAAPVAPGVSVGFFVNGQLVCSTETTMLLSPDDCETVTCTWSDPPVQETDAVDVTVTSNFDKALTECKDGNNDGVILHVFCKPVG